MLRRLCVLPLFAALAILSAAPAQANDEAHEAEIARLETALVQSQFHRWWAWAAVQEWNKAIGENWLAGKAYLDEHRATSRRPSGGGRDQGGRHYLCPQFATEDNPTGDFAIPCGYIDRESDGDYQADNPHSSAWGAYQIMDLPPGTSPADQDALARSMPLCHWQPPNYCAG